MAEMQSLVSTSEAYHAVFIDTSLDTHLAIIVSDLDTVSDLKRKIEKEYPLCFPNNGKIKVHAIKVKRRGHLYHLSDSMLVKSAFVGMINQSWFLRVDLSSFEEHDENQHLHNPDSNNLLTCFGITNNTSFAGVDVSLDDYPKEGTSNQNKEIDIPQNHVDLKDNKSKQADSQKPKNEHGLWDESLLKENIGSDKEQTGGNEEKSDNAALDSLTVNTMDNDYILENNSSSKKRKKKKRNESSNKLEQAVNIVPYSGKVLLEEDSMVTKSINHKDSGEPHIVSVLEQGVTPSQFSGILLKEKHVDLENTSKQADNRKRKNEHGLGDESLLKENIGSDTEAFSPEVTSQHTVGNKEKSENAAFDSLTVNTEDDDHILENSSSSKKRKKKKRKKSSNKLEEAVTTVPSSEKDLGEEDSRVPKSINHKASGKPNVESVPEQVEEGITPFQFSGICSKEKHCDSIQAEKNDTRPSAIDVDITKTNADNVLSKGEAIKELEISEVKKRRSSKDQSTVNVEGHLPCVFKDPNNLQMDVWLSRNENIGTDRSERVEEETALPQKNDYKGQRLEKCKSLWKDKPELNIQNLKVTSESSKENTPGKSGKRRKNTKTRGSVGEIVGGSCGDNVKDSKPGISSELAERHEAIHGEHPGNESKKEESNFSQTNDEEVLKMNAESTSLAMKNNDYIHNELQQTSATQGNAENKEEQVRKKSNKKLKSKAKNPSNLIAEVPNVSHQHSTTSTDNPKEVLASSNRTNRTKSEETAFKSNSNGTKLGLEKFEVETDPVSGRSKSESAKSTNVQSDTLDQTYQGSPDEVNVTGNPSNRSCADEVNNMKISSKDDKINIENHSPSQHQREVVDSGVVIIEKETKGTNGNEPKSKKRHRKTDVHSAGTSPDLQSSSKTNDKQGIGESLSVDKSDESILHSEKKLPKASKDGAKAPALKVSDKLNSVSEEARKQSVANVSKTHNDSDKQNSEAVAVANSVPVRSKKTVRQNRTVNKSQLGVDHSYMADGKVLGKDSGEVVNSSEQKKRLLGKSGSIFKDDSSGSSEEENGDDRSDTSTRTPSDYSLSSDYSDGESNANMNSPPNGSHFSDRKRDGRRNITKSVSSNLKDMGFDKILRSSSRYKKAKVTASQLHLENDTEDFEVVPDSQANL
ncbi:uncharacterized protein LOC107428516 [Ziziphus jujuba]|uniref:Uncharacterized protein LOC107428516 n=1 Tax=Ziziphus jujuba TaxID=326968 RepID=A0A6P4AIC4_ZIZJJ|nr:uncharacterized protein LOC107428516 [Ziziphus jujuba]